MRNTKFKLQKSFIQVFIDHIVSVERLKTGYNSLHINYIGLMSRVLKDAFLINLWYKVMSVETLKKGYNSLHIALHWFHVVSVETLRFTMYILIQSLRITIFFELMFEIHISSN